MRLWLSFFRRFWTNLLTTIGVGGSQPTAATPAGPASESGANIVTMLAPMHGPVIKQSASELIREYRQWLEEQAKVASTSTVAVLYASAYGNTASLAQVR